MGINEIKLEAENGDAKAQFDLGVLYYIGKGVPQDYAQAVIWYSKAANQGDSAAQCNLGNFYANNIGVPRNPVIACALWLVAVPSSEFAKVKRGILEKQMTPAEIAAAQALAAEIIKPGNLTTALDAYLAQPKTGESP